MKNNIKQKTGLKIKGTSGFYAITYDYELKDNRLADGTRELLNIAENIIYLVYCDGNHFYLLGSRIAS